MVFNYILVGCPWERFPLQFIDNITLLDLCKDDFTDYLDLEAIKKMCYSFIFQVIKTETSEDHFTVDASDEQSCNWMRFVNCAHSEDQQNLVSFQQGGEIYYRTCKAIDSGSELLVWFDDFFYTKNSSTQAFHSSSCEGERL